MEVKVNDTDFRRKKDVRALRNIAEIENMKWALRSRCSERDYIIFVMGINSGMRCGDIVKFRIEDIRGKKDIKITEKKTGKVRIIYLSAVYKELNAYIDSMGRGEGWLFPSRKGGGHISVVQVYRRLRMAAEWADIETGVGTHTMRKTHAKFLYNKTKNPEIVMNVLNHSSWGVTRRYVGITQDEIGEAYNGFKL